MEHYELKSDEVILFENQNVCVRGEKGKVQLFLTNYAIVVINKIKKLFEKAQFEVFEFSIGDIKVYHNEPQVKQKGLFVEVFMRDREIVFAFESKRDAHKFVVACLDLLTQKTSFERSASKVKDTVAVVDDALGVDTVGAVKTGVGGFFKGVVGAKKGAGIAKGLLGAIQDVVSAPPAKSEQKQLSSNDQLETLQKLKQMLDEGIITQEEFDKKKKEILGM